MLIRNVAYIIVMLLLSSCSLFNKCALQSQQDSVSVIIRESVVYKDSIIFVEVPAEKDNAVVMDSDTSRLETSLAKSEAWVTDGQLNHTLEHKPAARIEKLIAVPIYLHSTESNSIARQVVVKEVEKDLTNWQSFRLVLGSLVLILIVFWFILFIVRKAVKL